jgi:hypothetical protein
MSVLESRLLSSPSESTPEGKAIVEAKKVENTNTGSGVKP